MSIQPAKRSEKRFLFAKRMTYTLLAIILFIYGIIAIRNFLYPIAFGFLLAYLLYPFVEWLEGKRVPRILANFITIFSVIIFISAVVFVGFKLLTPMTGELPKMIAAGVDNLSEIIGMAGEVFGFEKEETVQIFQEQASNLVVAGGENLRNVFRATASTLIALGLMPVYVFMFLFYRTKFAYFLLQVVDRRHKHAMISILREISTVASRYIGGIIVVVLILCVINSIGLWIIGLRFFIGLGIISALFNLIPYFGTLLGGLAPLLFALLIQNDPIVALRVVPLFIIIQFTENNILTPNIVGSNVKINPFFIITGLVAASLIWGIPGMLLIVPFLAILRIIFSHIDAMKPYAFLLGEEGTARHSISIARIKRFFYRKKPEPDSSDNNKPK
jgi:predicted PurR-regulated permease PerM